MNDAATPQEKTTVPRLLTLKDCLLHMTPSSPLVLGHLGAAVYFRQGWVAALAVCLGREIVSYFFLLGAVRRGKRMIDPWSVEIKQRPLCVAERFDAVTGALAGAAALFSALFLLWGNLVGTRAFWGSAALHAALVTVDALRVRHLCGKAKNFNFEAQALEAIAKASATPIAPVVNEMGAQIVRPHWWTDAGTRDEVQQVGRKGIQ